MFQTTNQFRNMASAFKTRIESYQYHQHGTNHEDFGIGEGRCHRCPNTSKCDAHRATCGKVKNKGTQSAFTQSQFQVSHPGRDGRAVKIQNTHDMNGPTKYICVLPACSTLLTLVCWNHSSFQYGSQKVI